jgi:thioredoxin 1
MNHLLAISLLTGVLFFASCKWFGCCCHNHDKDTCSTDLKSSTGHESAPKKEQSAAVKEISTQEDFMNALKGDKPVIAKFSAPWCGACTAMKPIFEGVASKLQNQYTFIEIDVDKVQPDPEYGIQGIPTVIFFKGGKDIGLNAHVIGKVSQEELEKAIQKAFGS